MPGTTKPENLTDKHVDKMRDEVISLREQVDAKKAELVMSEAQRGVVVEHVTLTAERDRLKDELDALDAQLKVSKESPMQDQVIQQVTAPVSTEEEK